MERIVNGCHHDNDVPNDENNNCVLSEPMFPVLRMDRRVLYANSFVI